MHKFCFPGHVTPAAASWMPLAGLACLLVANACPVVAAAIEPMHSANWFNPERSGEGWSLEILDEHSAVGYWFTYDEEGEQRWLIGVGEIEGDRIEFPEMLVTSGGRFGPDFDPGEVVLEVAGSVSMTFSNCNNGQFEYSVFEQEMDIELARLSRTLTLDCEGANEDYPDGRGQQSGSWFDPGHSGEGFSLQWQTNGSAVVTWFTYDPDGRPYWMIGVGEKSGDVLVFPELIATRGARFGAEFDPNDVERFPWGRLQMDLGCASGSADYESLLPEFGSGSFELTRLTVLRGLDCTVSPPPDPSQANWRLISGGGPALSEMPAAAAGGFIYLGGGLISLSNHSKQFWRYAPETDTWQRMADLPAARDHGMAAAFDGKIYYFGGYASPLQSASTTAWRFDPAAGSWSILADMPRPRAAGGAAALGEYIYVAGGSSSTIDRYSPVSNTWTSIAIDDSAPRDHTAVAAHQGELWIIGGRSRVSGNTTSVLIFDPQSGSTRTGSPLQVGRSGFAAVSLGEALVAAGGEAVSGTLRSAEAFFSESGWELIDPLPVAVHGVGGATVDGKLYLMLGSTEGGGATNPGHVQILEPPSP